MVCPRLEIRQLKEHPEQWTLFVLSLLHIQGVKPEGTAPEESVPPEGTEGTEPVPSIEELEKYGADYRSIGR